MGSTAINSLLLMSTERGTSYVRTTSLGAKWAKDSNFCPGAWKLKPHTPESLRHHARKLMRIILADSPIHGRSFLKGQLYEYGSNSLKYLKDKHLEAYCEDLNEYIKRHV